MASRANHDFDTHWNTNRALAPSDALTRGAGEFLAPAMARLRSGPVKVLDVGAGNGVHWRFLRSIETDMDYKGVDISSLQVDRMNALAGNPSERFINADAASLPFGDECFDVVFAFGSVAYTASPERACSEMVRVCRNGGLMGLWVYPRREGPGGRLFGGVRALCRSLPPFLQRRVADLIVPLMALLPTRSRMNLSNSTWRQCREVVLVNIAPSSLVFPTREEVIGWLSGKPVEVVFEDPDNPITIWLRKGPVPA